MPIDEAIAKYKEITNTDAICPAHCNISCDNCVKESRQLTEWLEELKKRRNEDYGYLADIHQNIGYRKAIDDFTEKKQKIISQIDSMENENVYNVLFSLYIEKKSFEKISVEMDYSYRQTIRLHGKALRQFEEKFGDEYL